MDPEILEQFEILKTIIQKCNEDLESISCSFSMLTEVIDNLIDWIKEEQSHAERA